MVSNLMERGWGMYLEATYPGGLTDRERSHIRAAYYAGAWSLLVDIERISLAAPTRELGAAALMELYREVESYLESIARPVERH